MTGTGSWCSVAEQLLGVVGHTGSLQRLILIHLTRSCRAGCAQQKTTAFHIPFISSVALKWFQGKSWKSSKKYLRGNNAFGNCFVLDGEKFYCQLYQNETHQIIKLKLWIHFYFFLIGSVCNRESMQPWTGLGFWLLSVSWYGNLGNLNTCVSFQKEHFREGWKVIGWIECFSFSESSTDSISVYQG